MKKIYFSMMALAIAAFTFTSCEDVPEPYNNPWSSFEPEEEVTPLDPEGDGTEAAPFNVSGINEYATNLGLASGSSDTKEVYVKGIISNVANFQEKYGEIDYYVSDDKDGKTGQFYIYGGYGLDGAKFTSLADLSVGDTVLVSGTIKNHQGGIQFNYGSKIHSIKKGEGGGETPSADEVGSKDAPKSVTEALAAINAMEDGATSTEFWYVKGKVVKVTTNQASFDQYKNLNYLISEDGTESNTITVYAGNGLDNTQFSGIDALKQGDEVVVYGHIQKYVKNDKMTPEIAKGNYLVKYTAGGNGGGNTGDAVGTKDNPKTVAEALAAVDALAKGATTEQFWYVKGKVKQVITAADKISQYKNIDYLITDDGNNEIKVFRGKNLDNSDFTSADQLQVGDEVVVYGQLMKYEDTKNSKIVPEIAQGNYLVKRTANGNGGGNGGGNDGGGTVDGASITVVYGDLGLTDLSSAITLTDGTTLTFSQEDGKNPPIYHANTSIIRIDAHNSVTINAKNKKIAKVVFAYDTYQGTAYKGNEQMYGQAGSNKITPTKDDKNVTFSNVNNSTLKVVNDFDTNSGGTQFRCTGVTITYAE
ncbi:hypothetical protein M1D30_03315 [Prevotella sp. E15-22]|uniref:hypothetical protein n=1 Tax=Prevotella sp. E15-22 TaxID=2937774 RepID=UPI00206AFECC|nr:hypothetical protein [Prevotella sp. E15-22]UPS45214.1 hypothetical protein M1D30_03315 [Prevotella sp. E15-22]